MNDHKDEFNVKLEDGHSIECITHATSQRDGATRLSRRDFLHFLTLWPWPLTFWPNIHCWARYSDGLSLCQLWQFWFQPFWSYRADRQNHTQRGGWSLYSRDYSPHIVSANTAIVASLLLVYWILPDGWAASDAVPRATHIRLCRE